MRLKKLFSLAVVTALIGIVSYANALPLSADNHAAQFGFNQLPAASISAAIAPGTDVFSLRISAGDIPELADIYIGLSVPGTGLNNILYIRPDNTFYPQSAGIEPWKRYSPGHINESIIAAMPQLPAGIPAGTYTFYLILSRAGTPAGSFGSSYLWTSSVTVAGSASSDAVAAGSTVSIKAGINGASLYSLKCARCHGVLASSAKAGATVARIRAGISTNAGGMGNLGTLTTFQLQAIANALAKATPAPANPTPAPANPTPAPAPTTPAPAPAPAPATPAGATLYLQNCAGCHGLLANSAKKGATAAKIQGAINANIGGMGGLRTLTAAQVQDIANALSLTAPAPANPAPANPANPTPPSNITDGALLYSQNCASCHGTLPNFNKESASASKIQRAIAKNKGGMATLASLTPAQIQAIANAIGRPGKSEDGEDKDKDKSKDKNKGKGRKRND